MTNPCLTPKVVARLASSNVSGSLCSINRLLSRIAILTSQLGSAKKQITTLTSQIVDLTNRCNSADKKNMDLTSQNTAYLQRINELERSATLDSNNSCKPPSSDGLRKPNGKKRQRQER